jgi:hypothetical protein
LESLEYCRSCKSRDLIELINLGEQYFSGYFPSFNEDISKLKAPLVVVECITCRLVQLRDTFELSQMYGDNYGYRSGLNSSMVLHLKDKSKKLIETFKLSKDSKILDIGANDGTFLKNFSKLGSQLVAFDPTINNWIEFYDFEVEKYSLLFTDENISKAELDTFDLITSISMFYDVPEPINFAKVIKNKLKKDGIWHVELSYLPTMLKKNSYDTICHEHLEYYSLNSLNFICKEVGLQILDIDFNDVNGGSIEINLTHSDSKTYKPKININHEIKKEIKEIDTEKWRKFSISVIKNIEDIKKTICEIKDSSKNICGIGASTKGNIILQASKLSSSEIDYIGEINPNKYGKYTPGSNIKIVPETQFEQDVPDYMFVLPWHFKNHIIKNKKNYLDHGGKLIFPLPEIEII